MVIGVCELKLRIWHVNTLKEKRSIIKGIIGRTQSKFNVSIAEVGYLDVHKRSQIGIAYVSNDSAQAHRVLQKIVTFIESNFEVELIDYYIEMA